MNRCDWLMANLLIIFLIASLAVFLVWLVVDIRRKNYIGLILGLFTICLLLGAGYYIYVVDRFYDRNAMAEVMVSASQALQRGNTADVVRALDDYVSDLNHPSGSYTDKTYYDARNRMWQRLHEATTNKQEAIVQPEN